MFAALSSVAAAAGAAVVVESCAMFVNEEVGVRRKVKSVELGGEREVPEELEAES